MSFLEGRYNIAPRVFFGCVVGMLDLGCYFVRFWGWVCLGFGVDDVGWGWGGLRLPSNF